MKVFLFDEVHRAGDFTDLYLEGSPDPVRILVVAAAFRYARMALDGLEGDLSSEAGRCVLSRGESRAVSMAIGSGTDRIGGQRPDVLVVIEPDSIPRETFEMMVSP